MLLNNIERLDRVDFKKIANAHSKQYYFKFQEASDRLNPYWKRYSELNNSLDYLPPGSKDYAEIETECEKKITKSCKKNGDRFRLEGLRSLKKGLLRGALRP